MTESGNHDVQQEWNGAVIFVSFVMSFMGAYSVVVLAEQHRISGMLKSKFMTNQGYLVLMSVALGGAAIWCMHFVGMGAVTLSYLKDETDSDSRHFIEAEFDLGLTVISLVACVACVYMGLYVSSRDKMFIRDKSEIFEMISEEARKDKPHQLTSKYYIIRIALLRGIGPLIVGGVITGGGVCVMHYIGMLALVADVNFHYDPGIVLASVLIAVVASTVAFWILFRLLALYPDIESLRISSSLVMALAVTGMHYTGMAAVSYTVDHGVKVARTGKGKMNQDEAVMVALICSVAFNWLVGAIVQADLRGWHMYLMPQVKDSRKLVTFLFEKYEYDNSLRDFINKMKRLCYFHEWERQGIRTSESMGARVVAIDQLVAS